MFQPQPPVAQRRHRRLPSGTMVSYAEVKSYLSKREIPQLFESLMAGLMYHRPENHIGYLQNCLDEVKTNHETKIHWSTFVNKKKKSKEILPPLTPKKQDSFSSSWSDNSRQSTPLPPISARTVRTRTSPEQQQDLRNTYILYHNPPPILAKPKVPVISVLGGLGTKIDELCERVVSRLRGVVHISTCSMLKTRMTIEGFYRITSVPACAVVDSVLQAMSMVQSSNALIVAGFPRSRGDIEEYRSRKVRMDGVVLVDFEEDALRRFLKKEVATGTLRVSDIETELERYKQDIISVAEYYDDKELLTVVMGDQDAEEIVEDIVLAVDRIIESRKDIYDDGDTLHNINSHECNVDSPCKALLPSPEAIERPSTVEIRDATEEDIRAIEEEIRNSEKVNPSEEVKTQVEITSNSTEDHISNSTAASNPLEENISGKLESEKESSIGEEKASLSNEKDIENSKIQLLFAFENINADYESLKEFVVSEKGMCYIDFNELIRNDGENDNHFTVSESFNLLQSVLQRDSVSYSNGFFISGFPFLFLKENKVEDILKLGDVTFICKVKDKTANLESQEQSSQEDLLFKSPLSENVKIIFVTEANMVEELKTSFGEIIDDSNKQKENSVKSTMEEQEKNNMNELSIPTENPLQEDKSDSKPSEEDKSGELNEEIHSEDFKLKSDNTEVRDTNLDVKVNQDSTKETSSVDDNEDSTSRDVDDLISEDVLLDETKSFEQLENEVKTDKNSPEHTLSETSMERSSSAETLKEKAVLARQSHLEIETESISQASENPVEDELVAENVEGHGSVLRNKLTRQATFSSGNEPSSSHETPLKEAEAETASNDNNSNELENEEISAKPSENMSENQNQEIEKYSEESEKINQNSENEGLEEKGKDSVNSTEQDLEQKDDAQVEEDKDVENVTENKESGEIENSDKNVEDDSLVSNEDETNNNPDIEEPSGDQVETEASDKSIEDAKQSEVEEDNASNSEININDEGKVIDDKVIDDIEIDNESSKCDISPEHIIEEPQLNSEVKNSDSDEINEIKPEPQEVEEKINNENPPIEDVKDEITIENEEKVNEEEKVTDNSENVEDEINVSTYETELNTSDNNSEEHKDGDGNENDNVEEEDSSKESESDNKILEKIKEEEIGCPSDEEAETSQDKEENVNGPKEEIEITEEKIECAEEPEIKCLDADPTDSPDSQLDTTENKIETEISKVVDNDSDSNDERSVTIETKAEVHAADSKSPPLVDASSAEQMNETDQINENSNQESEKLDNLDGEKDNQVNSDDDNKHCDQDEKISIHSDENNKNPVNSDDEAENPDNSSNKNQNSVDSEKENENSTTSDGENQNSVVNEEHNGENNPELKENNEDNSDFAGTNSVEEMNNLNNERYSAKCQERNGSGILGESRHDDQPDSEEPQERSSSSSRGEL